MVDYMVGYAELGDDWPVFPDVGWPGRTPRRSADQVGRGRVLTPLQFIPNFPKTALRKILQKILPKNEVKNG